MRIDTPEEYAEMARRGEEEGRKALAEAEASGDTSDYWIRLWKWNVALLKEQGIEVPKHEPHPNEVATRKAVKDGIYSAEEVGLG